MKKHLLLIFAIFSATLAYAQTKSLSLDPKKIDVPLRSQKPEIYVGPSPVAQDSQNPQNYRTSPIYPNKPRAYSRWARGYGGLSLGVTNVGIIESFTKQSEDKIFKKSNSTEFGLGVSGHLDFPMPGLESSFRARAGFYRVETRPESSLKSTYIASQLEETESLLLLSFQYRALLPDFFGLPMFWLGAGGQLLYAFSTSKGGGDSGQTGSQLKYSFGLSPFASLGADIPFTTFSDFVLESNYIPWKGFNFLAGIRSTL